ncbi:hypothetical protein [Jatrophihabitans fulvus]
MSRLTDHANTAPDLERDLTPQTGFQLLHGSVPVLATPVAVAAGVTLAAGAAGAGFAVEEANDD